MPHVLIVDDERDTSPTSSTSHLSSNIETRTIDTHVMRLRDKLGPARALLETVRGVGYRIVDPSAS